VVEVESVAAAELVRAALGGGEVDFLLPEDPPVGGEEVRGVEDLAAGRAR
jgi:hypothetical protein